MVSINEGTWPGKMELPCRRCTDLNKEGLEVRWPLRMLYQGKKAEEIGEKKDEERAAAAEEIWRSVLQRGQDILCNNCDHELKGQEAKILGCASCKMLKLRKDFSAEMLEAVRPTAHKERTKGSR